MYVDHKTHEGVSQEKYFEMEGVSNSDIGLFLESPLKLLAKKAGLRMPTSKPMVLGSAFDTMLTEPDAMAARYAVLGRGVESPTTDMQESLARAMANGYSIEEAFSMSGYKRVDPKTADKLLPYSDFLRNAGSREVLTADEMDSLTEMVANTMAHETASRTIESSAKQVVITATHEATGIKVKGMLDLLTSYGVFDLKTTGEPVHRFPRKVFQYGYDRQLAHYAELARVSMAGLIAVERGNFSECECFELSEYVLDKGREKMDKALKDLAISEKNGLKHRADYYGTGWVMI